jgi:hypothetical protein
MQGAESSRHVGDDSLGAEDGNNSERAENGLRIKMGSVRLWGNNYCPGLAEVTCTPLFEPVLFLGCVDMASFVSLHGRNMHNN